MHTKSDHRTDVLRTIPIFQGCSDVELARIAGRLGEVELAAGEVLMRENEPGDTSYVLVSGSAKVTVEGVEVNHLHSGDLCGEMALLDGSMRSATVTATAPVRALTIPGDTFETIVRDPMLARRVLRTIVERLRAAEHGSTY